MNDPRNEMISVRLPPDLAAKVSDVSKRDGVSMSEFIRRAVLARATGVPVRPPAMSTSGSHNSTQYTVTMDPAPANETAGSFIRSVTEWRVR